MNNQAVIRTALRVGVIAGIICVGWIVLLYATGQNPFGPKRLMSFFVSPAAAVWAEWQLRQRHRDLANLGRQLLVGVVTVGMTALLAGTGMYGVARVAGPGAIERNRREMEQVVRAERARFLKEKGGKEQYERTLAGIATTPQGLATDEFSKKLILGLLLAVPGAIFLRR
ncbi:DUF4199 domain-containing protein [Hymenobacter sp. 15J16-1T3B]|uniref:DUF4199 domain-containing protein n=1 Tax=Hymenobacter sp. 15J16-1T3B TaxID=2886941 RepID=UPI001D127EB5|nr:DUF4199 domain-containing protein [Hymenobacter sp. 15J16-1T3B]MCC3160506.1 DUF4199 domain-containing protein [Hymenobacter sp. 15J16-1T3B]